MKVLLGLVAFAASGCASVEHVSVAPLPPDPTPDQRISFYETYHPIAQGGERTQECHRNNLNGPFYCSTVVVPTMTLPDGRIVRDPEDLAPLVAPDSHVIEETRRARTAVDRSQWWGLGAIAGLLGGMVVAIDGHGRGSTEEAAAGVGVGLGSLAVAGIASYIERDNAREARKQAFAWYPHDLSERLHLCWSGTRTVPCESITTGSPTALVMATTR